MAELGFQPRSNVRIADKAGAAAFTPFSVTINPGEVSIAANGIVNAESYTGTSTRATLQPDNQGNVSTRLAGFQVLFDEVPAPIIYVQAGQASVVVPYSLAGKTSTQVRISYEGKTSNPITVAVSSAAPGIFTVDASGQGQGAILNQDGVLNSPANPAAAGTYVFAYATGEGQTSPPGVDGKPSEATAPRPLQKVSAAIGSINAQVQYAGGASGLVAGLLQVNIQILTAVAPGSAVPIVLNVGGRSTQPNVTLSVR